MPLLLLAACANNTGGCGCLPIVQSLSVTRSALLFSNLGPAFAQTFQVSDPGPTVLETDDCSQAGGQIVATVPAFGTGVGATITTPGANIAPPAVVSGTGVPNTAPSTQVTVTVIPEAAGACTLTFADGAKSATVSITVR
jgi:hypothetical protein